MPEGRRFLGVGQHVGQELVELIVAFQTGEQLRQLMAHVQKLLERPNLLGDAGRLEIVDVLEVQLDRQLAVRVGQHVRHAQGQAHPRPGHDVVEVVAVDVDGLAFLERRQRLFGLPRQIGQDADHERQLDLLHGPAGFDVVGDLHPRPPHPV